jgi:hypothetical protein
MPQKESCKMVDTNQKKQIAITEIDTVTKEDELVLRVGFKLYPSRTSFSKVKADLYFDKRNLDSVLISIPQSPLVRDSFEFTPTLDMTGISAGSYIIKVEMHEFLPSGEKLNCTFKEVTVDYVPVTRKDRLIEVPIVKSVSGTDLVIFSDSEKDIYREIEETIKKELISERDSW